MFVFLDELQRKVHHFSQTGEDGIMLRNARAVLGLATVCSALAVMPANAVSTRISNFLFPCNGQNQATSFTFGSLPANANLLIVAAELVLFENRGGLQYVLLSVNGDRTKQLANMGLPASAGQAGGGDHVFNQSPYGLASATTDGAGQVRIQVDGACNGGFGNLQGTATVWFIGPGV